MYLFESFVEIMPVYLIPPSSFQAKSTVEQGDTEGGNRVWTDREVSPWHSQRSAMGNCRVEVQADTTSLSNLRVELDKSSPLGAAIELH
jgi:hypothetical protein